MEININLISQEEGKHKKVFLILGILGLAYLFTSLFVSELVFMHSFMMWAFCFPAFVEATLYGLGEKRILTGNHPFIKINSEGLESRKGGLFSKPLTVQWNNVKRLEIKLFELVIISTDDQVKSIDLNGLTDENLKKIKEFARQIKADRVI